MANKYREQARKAKRKRRERGSCKNKRRYSTEKDAEQTGMDIYKCKFCKGWHRATKREKAIELILRRALRGER